MNWIKRGYQEFVERLSWAIGDNLRSDLGMTFQDVLRKGLSTNGSELHALLAFRSIRHAARKMQRGIEGDVLEIGGYGHPGLALTFLLHGARKYYLNNISPVTNRMARSYAENLYALMELSLSTTCALYDVVETITGTDDVRIKQEHLEVISGVGASAIDLPENALDFVFSVTVLEHVEETSPLLSNALRMMKGNGWCYHVIDLRDHRNFSRPLEFLKCGPDEFRRVYSGSRARYREHVAEFIRCGYAVDFVEYATPPPAISPSKTDCFAPLTRRIEDMFVSNVKDIEVWVTEEMRAQFSEEYRSQSLSDLSVTQVSVAAHKPA